MECIVKAGEHEAVAMHLRNAYIAEHNEALEDVLDEYHVRNIIEGEIGHLKKHFGLRECPERGWGADGQA